MYLSDERVYFAILTYYNYIIAYVYCKPSMQVSDLHENYAKDKTSFSKIGMQAGAYHIPVHLFKVGSELKSFVY